MSLLGRAVVAIWNDIAPEGRDTFIEWHNREHMPERVAIPGFFRGRRYAAVSAAPEYFTLYEARDAQVLVSGDYLERLNNPTPWTRDATSHFRNTLRGICPVVDTAGTGEGVFLATFRFDAQQGHEARLQEHLRAAVLPTLLELGGITGVHLCIADPEASGLDTAERKGRNVDVPEWVVLIEGSSATCVDAASDRFLAADLGSLGCAAAPVRGLYQLEFSRVDPAPFT